MRAALCCAAMKLDRTLTDDIVSRQVTPAIKASNNRLCCNTMLATQLQQPPSSSQSALPMQLSGSLPMVFSSITACKLRSLHAPWDILGLCGNLGQIQGTNAVAAESRNLDRLSLSARLLFWEYPSFLALGCMHAWLPIAVKFAAFREAVKERIKNIGSRSER